MTFSGSYCFAQEASKNFEFGISVTPFLNVSQIGFEEIIENKNSLSLAVTCDVYFKLTDFLQLQSGLGAQQIYLKHVESFRWPVQNMNGEWIPSEDGIAKFKSGYIFLQVPLGLKLTPLKKFSSLFLNAGLIGGYKVASGGKIVFDEPGGNTINSDPDLFKLSSPQLFSSVGVGVEWKCGSKKFLINPIYQTSFSDIFSDLVSYHNGKFKFIGLRLGVY